MVVYRGKDAQQRPNPLTGIPTTWRCIRSWSPRSFLPTHYLTGAAAASEVMRYQSVSNIAGFVSLYSSGILRDLTGSDGGYIRSAFVERKASTVPTQYLLRAFNECDLLLPHAGFVAFRCQFAVPYFDDPAVQPSFRVRLKEAQER